MNAVLLSRIKESLQFQRELGKSGAWIRFIIIWLSIFCDPLLICRPLITDLGLIKVATKILCLSIPYFFVSMNISASRTVYFVFHPYFN